MTDYKKVIDFIQEFGCAKLEHLQILFNEKNNSFNQILNNNMISKKDGVFIHNTRRLDNNMLIALDALCQYKDSLVSQYTGFFPVYIKFLTKENETYGIIVADEETRSGVVKALNSDPPMIPAVDKLILLFPDSEDYNKINCEKPFMYATYPDMEIID